jgi:hypothetical protein
MILFDLDFECFQANCLVKHLDKVTWIRTRVCELFEENAQQQPGVTDRSLYKLELKPHQINIDTGNAFG